MILPRNKAEWSVILASQLKFIEVIVQHSFPLKPWISKMFWNLCGKLEHLNLHFPYHILKSWKLHWTICIIFYVYFYLLSSQCLPLPCLSLPHKLGPMANFYVFFLGKDLIVILRLLIFYICVYLLHFEIQWDRQPQKIYRIKFNESYRFWTDCFKNLRFST